MVLLRIKLKFKLERDFKMEFQTNYYLRKNELKNKLIYFYNK